MKKIQIIITLIFIPTILFANIIKINKNFNYKNIENNIYYLEDTTNSIIINDIIKNENIFTHSKKQYLNFKYSKSSYWLKIILNNTEKQNIDIVIDYSYPLIDYLNFYYPKGKGYAEIKTGDKRNFSNRPLKSRTFSFPLTLKPGKSTYYIKIKSTGALLVNLSIWSKSHFFDNLYNFNTIIWFYFGLLFSIILYNIFIFISFKDLSYLYLAIFILSMGFYAFIDSGLAKELLWPNSHFLNNPMHPFTIFSIIFSTLMFTRNFFHTKRINKKLDFSLKIFSIIIILLAIFSFIDFTITTQITVYISPLVVILIYVIAVIAFIKHIKEAKYFLIAWTIFLAGVTIHSMRIFSYLPDIFIINWSFQLGSLSLATILSFGISDKIKKITFEKRRAFDALIESEKKYKILVENAHEGIMLVFKNSPIYANKQMIAISTIQEKDFPDKKILDFFPDSLDIQKTIKNKFDDKNFKENFSERFQTKIISKKNKILDVIMSIAHIKVGGQPGFIVIINDISELIEAKETILDQISKNIEQYNELQTMNKKNEEERNLLQLTLSSIGDGVITYDVDNNIILMNNSAEEITGWLSEDAIGEKVTNIISINDKDTQNLIFNKLKNSEFKDFDTAGIPFFIKDKFNNEKIIELTGAQIYKNKYQLSGMVLVLHDITEKFKLEKELLKMSKMESLGILAGGIAHDFNNLLTAIIGNIELLKSSDNNKEQLKDIYKNIEKAGNRAVNLTKQLMTFSKGGEPIKAVADIGETLKETSDFILSGTNIQSELNIDKNLWATEIDIGQISQVFNNLIINAIQAMPHGGKIKITAVNLPEIPPEIPLLQGKYIKISISDNGPGIPKKNLKKIFDPYFTTKKSGTGLGLASSYSIIQRHSGFIKPTSEKNQGTTFTIYLKATDKKIVKQDSGTLKKKIHSGRLLIMDDEQYILDVASKMFKLLGYEVDTSKNGEETLSKFKNALSIDNPYTLFIIDLTIRGGMGGKETIKKLLELDKEITAIVSSGYSDEKILSQYKEYGFKGILLKPYTLKNIEEVLKEINN